MISELSLSFSVCWGVTFCEERRNSLLRSRESENKREEKDEEEGGERGLSLCGNELHFPPSA